MKQEKLAIRALHFLTECVPFFIAMGDHKDPTILVNPHPASIERISHFVIDNHRKSVRIWVGQSVIIDNHGELVPIFSQGCPNPCMRK